MKGWLLTAVLLCWGPLARAEDPNVILITLDGVRWSEVFEGTDPELTEAPREPIMNHLTGELALEGMLLGDRENSWVTVANPVNMSLPGYQSIFAGAPTGCYTNFCRTIRHQTFPEQLQKEFGFSPDEMAAFASWSQIRRAYARRGSKLYLNAGDAPSRIEDPVHVAIDGEQARNPAPWNRPGIWRARYDRYTYAHALHYLKTKRPRFLYLSLLDADEYAHAGNYEGYVASLKSYDQWIREIADTLDASGEYGRNTLLIVTTDHGRGDGKDWTEHGFFHPESERIWMYLRGKGIAPGSSPLPGTHLSHNSVRMLVESAFNARQPLELMLNRHASRSQ
jgi:hypothetical protein